MQNEYIAPVDHGVLSTTGNVAAGTAGGALKAVGKVALWSLAIGAVVGGLWGAGLLTPVFAALAGSATTGAIALTTGKVLGGIAVGLLGGGIVAAALSAPAAMVGASKGASHASERVALERGAAKMMEIEMAANIGALSTGNNGQGFAPQGSRMNMARPQIQAATAQDMGTLQTQQLVRA